MTIVLRKSSFYSKSTSLLQYAKQNVVCGVTQTMVEFALPKNKDRIFTSRYQNFLHDKHTFINLLNENDV